VDGILAISLITTLMDVVINDGLIVVVFDHCGDELIIAIVIGVALRLLSMLVVVVKAGYYFIATLI
jgi:cytochrome c oxidase subunit IV